MKTTIFHKIVAALVLSAMLIPTMVQPAKADGRSTTSTLLIAGAAAAILFSVANAANKNATASRVQGYLPDGSTVFADGHVVSPNGQSWYPGNQGQQVACNNEQCYITGNGYNTAYNGGYYNNGSGRNNNYNYSGHRNRSWWGR